MAEVKKNEGQNEELSNLTNELVVYEEINRGKKKVSDLSLVKTPSDQNKDLISHHEKTRKILKNKQLSKKESPQSDVEQRFLRLGASSALDKLLGLDLRPTMIGILLAPPGNSDSLRHISPSKRRTIIRNMLTRQRTTMRKLSDLIKNESILDNFEEPLILETSQINRAIDELGKAARMLDVLDELLAMQDYTISQVGSFSKG